MIFYCLGFFEKRHIYYRISPTLVAMANCYFCASAEELFVPAETGRVFVLSTGQRAAFCVSAEELLRQLRSGVLSVLSTGQRAAFCVGLRHEGGGV